MTKDEKAKVEYLRAEEGLGYRVIAARLGLPLDTVKSHCRRKGLGGVASKAEGFACRYCGERLPKEPVRKNRKFCSDACRRAWWKEHPELRERRTFYPMVCALCGKEFQSYENKKRTYCSSACYFEARFGKPRSHDEGAV